MTVAGSTRGDGKSDGLCPWSPSRLRASLRDDDADVLRLNVQGLLSRFIKGELGVEAEFQQDGTAGDTIEVVSAVDGFADALACRIGMPAGKWLIRELYGASQSARLDASVDLCGPIVRQAVSGLLLLFVDKFCEVASSIGEGSVTRKAEQPTSAGAAIDSAAAVDKENARICVEPSGVRVEYELSLTDLRRLLSDRDRAESPKSVADGERPWEFESRIDDLPVRLHAVFDDRDTTLGEIKEWRVGAMVRLISTPASVATLAVEGNSLFNCELARDSGYFALRLLNECG